MRDTGYESHPSNPEETHSTRSSDSLAQGDMFGGRTRSLPMTTQHVILSERSESKNLLRVGRSFQSLSSRRRLERSAHHRETHRLARRHSFAQGDMSFCLSVGSSKASDGGVNPTLRPDNKGFVARTGTYQGQPRVRGHMASTGRAVLDVVPEAPLRTNHAPNNV